MSTPLARALSTTLAAVLLSAAVAAQEARVQGAVRDGSTDAAVEGARVDLRRGGTIVATGFTDPEGRFALAAPAGGGYGITVRRIDYRPHALASLDLVAGETLLVARILLEPHAFTLNPVVVSASRTAEKALEAPASVTVLGRPEVEARTALAPADHVAGVTGVDLVTTGITQHEIVVRGFNNVSSGALLILTDNRYAAVPSLRINVDNFIPLVTEDIERIEIVRGPGAALYGPNSTNGVLHLITRSPLDAPGTSVALVAGERNLLQASARHAMALGGRFGVKLSAQYLRATDWPYEDPTEAFDRAAAISAGALADTLRIGARDDRVERMAADAQLEWRSATGTRVVTSAGANAALSSIELTPLGAAQIQDWRYYYVQSRVTRGRLFAQVFLDASDASDTYLLRTGEDIRDHSQMLVAQLQHGSLVGRTWNLTYGVDMQRTVPRTDGTLTGRNEEDDTIDEAGAYLHAEGAVAPTLDVVAAVRADYHNRLPNPIASPRAALVFTPTEGHAVRLTYNRAFSTPNTNNLFLDVLAYTLPTPIPMNVRLVGVPETGFHYPRECGGLCMYSAYNPAGTEQPLPIDATALWDVLIDTLAARGIDLSALPVPTAADVATRLAKLDIATGQPVPVTDVTDIPALTPAITNTVELGYRATLGSWASLAVDVYRAWRSNFVSAERVETPNAFFDRASLEAYLAQYLPADSAALLAFAIGQVPVGTVTPVEARDLTDILVTYRNFGSLAYWGADIEASAFLTPSLAVRGSYSWTNRESFAVEVPGAATETIPLNAPSHRGTLAVLYRDTDRGLSGELRARAVDGFTMESGVYAGDVEPYLVLDASVDVRVPSLPYLTATVSALNLLDNRHHEFVGAPALGRLVTVRLRWEM